MRASNNLKCLVVMAALCLGPACSSDTTSIEVDQVTPAAGSARGGDRVTVTGSGFAEGVRVWFGDVEAAEVTVVSETELRVTTPVHLAGTVDLRIEPAGGDARRLEEAFSFVPLELSFQEATPSVLPPLVDLAVTDLAVADLDGNGAPDLLVGANGGESRVLANRGGGHFVDTTDSTAIALPRWESNTRQLVVADFDDDGRADLFPCVADGTEARPYRNVVGERFEAAGAEGLAPRGCRRAVATDLNGDGRPDLLIAEPTPGSGRTGLRALLNRSTGPGSLSFEVVESLASGASAEGLSAGGIWTSAPEITGDFTYTHAVAASGQSAGRLRYDFTAQPAGTILALGVGGPVHSQPGSLNLQIYGDGSGHLLTVEVVDASGERFSTSVGAVDWQGWAPVGTDPVTSWASVDGDGVIDLPATINVGLEAGDSTALAGEIFVDDVTAGETGQLVIADLEHNAVHWPGQVADLRVVDVDVDGRPDVLVVRSDPSLADQLRLLLNTTGPDTPDALRFGDVSARLPLPESGVSRLGAIDSDGDGDPDLVALSPDGQDRLYVNDGAGFFFDDTPHAMPLGSMDAHSLATADLNLDGRTDLIIANRDGVNRLYTGSADGRFHDHTPALPLQASASEIVVAFDADSDGDVDFVVANGGGEGLRAYFSVRPPALDAPGW